MTTTTVSRLARLAVLACVAAGASTSCQVAPRTLACNFLGQEEVAACAEQRSDGTLVVRPQALKNANFGPEGVGGVVIAGQLYFVDRAGKTAPALNFDNGPDYFVEGLARTVRDRKIGFVDSTLREVIAPTWDFAFPFEDGLSVVCQGCVSTPALPGDEHQVLQGGKWGYINEEGKVIVPVIHEQESLPSRESMVR